MTPARMACAIRVGESPSSLPARPPGPEVSWVHHLRQAEVEDLGSRSGSPVKSMRQVLQGGFEVKVGFLGAFSISGEILGVFGQGEARLREQSIVFCVRTDLERFPEARGDMRLHRFPRFTACVFPAR